MYWFKILCEISKVPFEISHKILNPYTAKYEFYEVLKTWRLMISYSYDILSVNETDPRSVSLQVASSPGESLSDDRFPNGVRYRQIYFIIRVRN